jgi:transposase
VSDFFGAQGLVLLHQRLELLPPCTAYATQQLLEQVENLDRQVRGFEHQMQTVFRPTPTIQLLLTLPGVGLMLAVVIALEVGSVARFATAEKLAAYAGTTPRPRERRQDPLRACPPGRQSLPRVGLRRSRQRMIPAPRERISPGGMPFKHAASQNTVSWIHRCVNVWKITIM